ncbi:MAG TPA: EAL domain-containing protein [Pyrinomonadaceae bacterium]|nr:EAL domain-containing protein [Pyrinomonadaceae bacterium]
MTAPPRPIRALLVDDDEDDYVMTREMLSEVKGEVFRLDWVPSYHDALETIRRGEHDVYLLDYRLGGHNGLDILREARGGGCGAPMILLTGQGDDAVDVEAMKAGASDYLVKGQIEPSLLGRSIRYAVERAQALGALRETEERYQRLVELSPDAIIVHSGARIRFVNGAGVKLLGAAGTAQVLGKLITDFVRDDRRENVENRIHQTIKEETALPFVEEKLRRLDGKEVYVEVAAVPFVYEGEAAVQVVARDISRRKEIEERLIHDAFHDALTGLPNRVLFAEHLKLAVERAKRPKRYLFAVLFLDLDRFKNINDSLGHTVGDQLLIGIARRFEGCLRHIDTVARLGGDEFAVLLDGIEDSSDAVRVAERLQKALRQPLNLGGHEVFTSASIGIALSSTGYEQPEEVVRDADTAMYRAKALGKARHEIFDTEMHARAVTLLRLENDLRRAVERDEFCVYYQPIISLDGGGIYGFEALVRWQHPERGLVAPSQFITVAEETGLIIPIGRWVLREACRQMRQWQKQFPSVRSLTLSVNLSGKQLTQPDLVAQVKQILRESDFDPRLLQLEITESAVIENTRTVTEMLLQLRDLGLRLSMDDFGTGYSSLSYLHRFPINTIKIDRSFINSREGGDENEIVRTIIMLARSMGMNVVAEGVETQDQLSYLKSLDCEYGQGFLFSRPVHAGAVEQMLQPEGRTHCDDFEVSVSG